MLRIRNLVVMTTLVLAYGCAFRKDTPSTPDSLTASPTPAESATPQAVVAPDPVLAASYVRVAWWTDERTKSPFLARSLVIHKEERLMNTSTPVTLPAQVPDRIEVELSFPTTLADLSQDGVSIQALPSIGQATAVVPKHVTLVSKDTDLSVYLIEIEGMRQLLSDQSESTVELRFLLQKRSGATPLTIVASLRTPPALLTVEQVRFSDSLLEGFKNSESLKRIDLGGRKFDLLQVGRIKNFSPSPIELSVPSRSRSALVIQRTHYHAQAAGKCAFHATLEKKRVPIGKEVRTFALHDDLQKELTTAMSRSRDVSSTQLIIPSNEEARIGFYDTGEDSAAIAQGTYQKRKPGHVRVPDRCEPRCDHKRMAPTEFPLCWGTNYNNLFGIPRWKVQSCLDCGNGDQKACGFCAAWELKDADYIRVGPNCLFCGELTLIGMNYQPTVRWREEVIYIEKALSGDEDGEISMISDPKSALLTLRFSDLNPEEDPQTRSVHFLKENQPQE